jgi:hypothetical protein
MSRREGKVPRRLLLTGIVCLAFGRLECCVQFGDAQAAVAQGARFKPKVGVASEKATHLRCRFQVSKEFSSCIAQEERMRGKKFAKAHSRDFC